jgi:hypothetical protein
MARLTQYPQLLSRCPSHSNPADPGQCLADIQNFLGSFLSPITQTSTNETRNSQASDLRAEEALCICPSGCTHCYLCHYSPMSTAPIIHYGPIFNYLTIVPSFHIDIGHAGVSARLLSAGTQGAQRLRLHTFAMRVL